LGVYYYFTMTGGRGSGCYLFRLVIPNEVRDLQFAGAEENDASDCWHDLKSEPEQIAQKRAAALDFGWRSASALAITN